MARKWEKWEDVPANVARQVLVDLVDLTDSQRDIAANSDMQAASKLANGAANAVELLIEELRERYMDAEPRP